MNKTCALRLLLTGALAAGFACSGDDDDGDDTTIDRDGGVTRDGGSTVDPTDPPTTYTFESRFEAGASSVVHSGQTLRHVLIVDMKNRVSGLTDRIDMGTFTPTTGDVMAELEFYLEFDAASAGGETHGIDTTPAALQTTYGEIGSANLIGKIAGNDEAGQHEDWTMAFRGWDDASVTTPESLVRLWFAELDTLAARRAAGDIPVDPDGNAISEVYVSPEGLDYSQLLQKFLTGAIAYSQGADDYLDDDTDGKGLRTDNTMADGDSPYTALEHQWDEGFGYFGASHDYAMYDDDEIAAAGGREGWSSGYHDTDGDGSIDLLSEYVFGHAQNAGKRDRGAVVATDFTKDAIDAFTAGRHIIATAGGALDTEKMAALVVERDKALTAWEAAIAATVVHYINDTLQDMEAFGTSEYNFYDHAKHWSEMKGFALAFQFSRHSSLTDAQFEMLHALLRDAPVLPGSADIEQYKTDLRDARAMIGSAMGFASDNLGDMVGENGW